MIKCWLLEKWVIKKINMYVLMMNSNFCGKFCNVYV